MAPVIEKTRIAKLISDRIEELKGVKTQKDIADIVGYKNQNMITMLKQGDSKVALDRVGDLAKALEVDPALMMRLAMEQFYAPSTVRELMTFMETPITKNEMAFVEVIREASDHVNPVLTEELAQKIRAIF